METVTQDEEKLQNGDETRDPSHSKQKSDVLTTDVNSLSNTNHFCNGDAETPELCNGLEHVLEWSEACEETESLLRQHSGCGGPWRLFRSPVEGRGLVAARAIRAGELVLREPPLVLAPRAVAAGGRPLCARCLRMRQHQQLHDCPAGCGMAVCCPAPDSAAADCAPDGHAGECSLLRAWGLRADDGGSAHAQRRAVLGRASAALRCLALPQQRRRLVSTLYAHTHPRHGWEVTDMATELRSAPTSSQLRFMRRACAVMDANAFEVSAGVRGLYPLSAMMNNECAPNTTHGFDAQHAMVVRAAVDIPEGRELTNSYTPLLWGTPARQRHLQLTKHFLCRCDRCQDPQEFGSLLSALRCGRGGCPGAIVSAEPLEPSSPWRCLCCGRELSAAKAGATQAALGAVLARVDTGRPEAVAASLSSPLLARALHPSNQVAFELKSCLLWHYGHSQGYSWAELSEDQLLWKESACRELLSLLQQLRAGRTRLTGLLMLELSCTLEERLRRQQGKADDAVRKQMETCLHEAASVFAGDVTAPPELWRRVAASDRKLPGNEFTGYPLEAPPDGLNEAPSNHHTQT